MKTLATVVLALGLVGCAKIEYDAPKQAVAEVTAKRQVGGNFHMMQIGDISIPVFDEDDFYVTMQTGRCAQRFNSHSLYNATEVGSRVPVTYQDRYVLRERKGSVEKEYDRIYDGCNMEVRR